MMPAGEYYVGDLCYVMNDEWDEVCSNLTEGEHTLKDGRKYVFYHTKYGDGLYYSNIHTKHPVDAGLIGCIAQNHCDEYNGAIVKFDKPFSHGVTEDGVIWFGHVRIPTGDSDEDEGDGPCPWCGV